jgi:hypothetical protein
MFNSSKCVQALPLNVCCLKDFAIALVDFDSMVNRHWNVKRHWNLNPKLCVLLKVAHLQLLNEGKDVFVEPQNLCNPPVECRLMVNALRNGAFSHLLWMRLLQVFEGLPCHGAILPLAADLPTIPVVTLGGGMSFNDNILVCEGNCGRRFVKINKAIKQ